MAHLVNCGNKDNPKNMNAKCYENCEHNENGRCVSNKECSKGVKGKSLFIAFDENDGGIDIDQEVYVIPSPWRGTYYQQNEKNHRAHIVFNHSGGLRKKAEGKFYNIYGLYAGIRTMINVDGDPMDFNAFAQIGYPCYNYEDINTISLCDCGERLYNDIRKKCQELLPDDNHDHNVSIAYFVDKIYDHFNGSYEDIEQYVIDLYYAWFKNPLREDEIKRSCKSFYDMEVEKRKEEATIYKGTIIKTAERKRDTEIVPYVNLVFSDVSGGENSKRVIKIERNKDFYAWATNGDTINVFDMVDNTLHKYTTNEANGISAMEYFIGEHKQHMRGYDSALGYSDLLNTPIQNKAKYRYFRNGTLSDTGEFEEYSKDNIVGNIEYDFVYREVSEDEFETACDIMSGAFPNVPIDTFKNIASFLIKPRLNRCNTMVLYDTSGETGKSTFFHEVVMKLVSVDAVDLSNFDNGKLAPEVNRNSVVFLQEEPSSVKINTIKKMSNSFSINGKYKRGYQEIAPHKVVIIQNEEQPPFSITDAVQTRVFKQNFSEQRFEYGSNKYNVVGDTDELVLKAFADMMCYYAHTDFKYNVEKDGELVDLVKDYVSRCNKNYKYAITNIINWCKYSNYQGELTTSMITEMVRDNTEWRASNGVIYYTNMNRNKLVKHTLDFTLMSMDDNYKDR